MRICSWYNLENILCAHSSYICSCSGAKEDGLKCISLQLYSAGHKMFQISTNYEYSTFIQSYMATNLALDLIKDIFSWVLHMICRNDISKLKYRKITNMPPHARWQSSLNGEKTVSSGWYFHTVKLNWKVRVINSYLRISKGNSTLTYLCLKFHLSQLILNRFRPCNINTYSIIFYYSVNFYSLKYLVVHIFHFYATQISYNFLIQRLQCYLAKI